MVLVVFDEARNLLKHPTTGSNYFDVLQNALVSANIDIGNKGRIFGVLVDTNPRITDPSPSSRRINTKDRRSFQPFVLTHSKDAKWQQYCRDKLEEVRGVPMDTGGGGDEDEVSMSDQLVVYKRIVEGNDEKGAWDALKRMGRPLWTDLCKNWRDDKVKLVSFAACKLMLGVSPWQESNFTVDTMFGVASMLCRLGVRPRWTSEIAPLFVANFMATLAYVNYEGNAFLSSYASKPVLTFGAVSVWYALDNGLGKYILPQLKKLISSEVLDTDGVEKIAARILMLLAMDQCLMNSYGINDRLIGQLVSVGKFLEVLRVGEMQIFSEEEETPSEVERPAFNQWLLKWEGWYVGFTHFVELVKEPSEETLWNMLGRRAAGVIPRDEDGADLIIPLLKKKLESDSIENTDNATVSLMMVKVGNWSTRDSAIFQSDTKELSAWFGFTTTGNSLGKTAVDDVIRIYMDVGEDASGVSDGEDEDDVSRFIYASSLADDTDSMSSASSGEEETAETTAFTLCFRSITCDTFSFLSKDVAESLASIVGPSWSPAALDAGAMAGYREMFPGRVKRAGKKRAGGGGNLKKFKMPGRN